MNGNRFTVRIGQQPHATAAPPPSSAASNSHVESRPGTHVGVEGGTAMSAQQQAAPFGILAASTSVPQSSTQRPVNVHEEIQPNRSPNNNFLSAVAARNMEQTAPTISAALVTASQQGSAAHGGISSNNSNNSSSAPQRYGGFVRLSELRRQHAESSMLSAPAPSASASVAPSAISNDGIGFGVGRIGPVVTSSTPMSTNIPASLLVERRAEAAAAASRGGKRRREDRDFAAPPSSRSRQGRGGAKQSTRSRKDSGLPLQPDGTLYTHYWVTERKRRVFVYNKKKYKGSSAHRLWSKVKAKQEELDVAMAYSSSSSSGNTPLPTSMSSSSQSTPVVKVPSSRAQRSVALANTRPSLPSSSPLMVAYLKERKRRLANEARGPRDVSSAQRETHRTPSVSQQAHVVSNMSSNNSGAQGYTWETLAAPRRPPATPVPKAPAAIAHDKSKGTLKTEKEKSRDEIVVISDSDDEIATTDARNRKGQQSSGTVGHAVCKSEPLSSLDGSDEGFFYCDEMADIPLSQLAAIWGLDQVPQVPSHHKSYFSDKSSDSLSSVSSPDSDTSDDGSSFSSSSSSMRSSSSSSESPATRPVQHGSRDVRANQTKTVVGERNKTEKHFSEDDDDDDHILLRPAQTSREIPHSDPIATSRNSSAVGSRVGLIPIGVAATNTDGRCGMVNPTRTHHYDAMRAPFVDRYENDGELGISGVNSDLHGEEDLFVTDEVVGGYHFGGL